MADLIYVDTNVYISYFRQESDSLRLLGDFAFELFRKTLSCSYVLVVSSWVLKELSSKIDEQTVNEFVAEFNALGKLRSVGASASEFSCCKTVCELA